MQTFDVVLAHSPRDVGQVLLTTADQASADRIVEAIRGAKLFQADGLKPYAKPVDRAGEAAPDAPVAPITSAKSAAGKAGTSAPAPDASA